MGSTKELIAKIERVRSLLRATATGEGPRPGDDEEYAVLRAELIKLARLKSRLPQCVLNCRNLDDFWIMIKPMFPSYAERRHYLHEEFSPVLLWLEEEATAPGDATASTVLTVVDSEHIQEAWQKALDRRRTDPDGAITMARTLLETVCKHILDEEGIAYDSKDDLPKLYKSTAARLNLAPDQHQDEIFKRILGGCYTVVEGLGAIRNRLGDAHGKGKRSFKAAPRHATLAVNLAGAAATFIIETWEERVSKKPESS